MLRGKFREHNTKELFVLIFTRLYFWVNFRGLTEIAKLKTCEQNTRRILHPQSLILSTKTASIKDKSLFSISSFRPRPHHVGEIWKRSVISVITPTIRTNPSRKGYISKTLFKPEAFKLKPRLRTTWKWEDLLFWRFIQNTVQLWNHVKGVPFFN